MKVFKIAVELESREQADAAEAALDDQVVKAFVVVMGSLLQLPTDRARRRVLAFVADKINEEARQDGGE